MRFFIVLIYILFFTSYLFPQTYWQQGVNYKINAALDVDSNIISGQEDISYSNNSPDTLKEIYFHLYWNAFKPGSYMNRKSITVNRDNGKRISYLAPEEQGDVRIVNVTVDGIKVQVDEYDTILRLILNNPLPPHSSTKINLDFRSKVPKLTRRSGRDSQQGVRFSMAQWYPKISEYDNEGWHIGEYAGREFYGIWGNFDVKITLDANYILGATGILQNPKEVKCGYELNSDEGKWKKDSGEIFSKGSLKTWHFRADSVHDFAWVADYRYIHDMFRWNDVRIHVLYLPEYSQRWEQVKYYAYTMLDFYSENYGLYPYKQFTVALAGDGGMEYPNIIFNAGNSPGLVAHEGGHQWFYGILGNNESREAWLDEGFVTYSTQKTLIDRYGMKYINPTGLKDILQPPGDEHNDFRTYWTLAKLGIEEPLLTHSDHFKHDIVYNFATYQKGAMILPLLEYAIGDSAFSRVMKKYFEKWKSKHPKSSDFQRVAELESGMELDIFFDEWLRTTKTCDYAISKFKGEWVTENNQKKFRLFCELKNNDDIILPVDLSVSLRNGKTYKFNIPIGWNSKKEEDLIILPRWDWVDNVYSFTYDFEDEAVFGEIDPSLRVPDINRLNNTSGFLPKFDTYFIRPIQLDPPIDAYWINFRPSLGYSIPDGIRAGFMGWGGYMGYAILPPEYATRYGVWYGLKSNQVDFDLGYSSSIGDFGKTAYFDFSFSKMNGIRKFSLGIDKILDPKDISYFSNMRAGLRLNHTSLVENDFPFYNLSWEKGDLNFFEIYYSMRNSSTSLKINSEVSFGSITDYSKINLDLSLRLYKNYINMRLFAGYSRELPPVQKQFNLVSANPFEQYENIFYRDILSMNKRFPEEAHFSCSGGGNLRGYFNEYNGRFGKNIFAMNFEFVNSNLSSLLGNSIPYLPEISFSFFFDIGNVWNSGYNNFHDFMDNVIGDLGMFFELPFIENRSFLAIFPYLENVSIRFNLPFWISNPKFNDKQFAFRWNISIGKTIF